MQVRRHLGCDCDCHQGSTAVKAQVEVCLAVTSTEDCQRNNTTLLKGTQVQLLCTKDCKRYNEDSKPSADITGVHCHVMVNSRVRDECNHSCTP